jgi:hypothetical protein
MAVFNPSTDYSSDYQYMEAAEELTLTHSPVDGSGITESEGNGARRSIMQAQYTELRSAFGMNSEDAVFLYWPEASEVPAKSDKLVGASSGTWYVRSVEQRHWGPYYVLGCTKGV